MSFFLIRHEGPSRRPHYIYGVEDEEFDELKVY